MKREWKEFGKKRHRTAPKFLWVSTKVAGAWHMRAAEDRPNSQTGRIPPSIQGWTGHSADLQQPYSWLFWHIKWGQSAIQCNLDFNMLLEIIVFHLLLTPVRCPDARCSPGSGVRRRDRLRGPLEKPTSKTRGCFKTLRVFQFNSIQVKKCQEGYFKMLKDALRVFRVAGRGDAKLLHRRRCRALFRWDAGIWAQDSKASLK